MVSGYIRLGTLDFDIKRILKLGKLDPRNHDRSLGTTHIYDLKAARSASYIGIIVLDDDRVRGSRKNNATFPMQVAAVIDAIGA